MGTGPAATAQKRLADMSVIRYVRFFFHFFFFFSWTWWWVRSQSLFNSGLTVPMKHSHHTDHYFSSMPFSPITLFTQLVESFYWIR